MLHLRCKLNLIGCSVLYFISSVRYCYVSGWNLKKSPAVQGNIGCFLFWYFSTVVWFIYYFLCLEFQKHCVQTFQGRIHVFSSPVDLEMKHKHGLDSVSCRVFRLSPALFHLLFSSAFLHWFYEYLKKKKKIKPSGIYTVIQNCPATCCDSVGFSAAAAWIWFLIFEFVDKAKSVWWRTLRQKLWLM